MATLRTYSALISAKGLDELLGPYMDKPLTWFVQQKENISRTFNNEIGLNRTMQVTQPIWDIINPNFKTGIDEGYLKDATYVALVYAVLNGQDSLVRNTFSKKIANVNSKLYSIGRIVGTAKLKGNLMRSLAGGRHRKTRRAGEKRRKTRRARRRRGTRKN